MSWPPRRLDHSPWLEAKQNKLITASSVWIDVFDRLFWYMGTSSTYYPEKFPPGDWYEKYVTDEEKEILEKLTADNMVLPAPLWKLFGGSIWEVWHRSCVDGKTKSYGRLNCGSCQLDLKGDRHCLKKCDPDNVHLCPFDRAFDPNGPRRSSLLKIL